MGSDMRSLLENVDLKFDRCHGRLMWAIVGTMPCGHAGGFTILCHYVASVRLNGCCKTVFL